MATNTTAATGLFLAAFTIQSGLAGAPIFDLKVTVDTVSKSVVGVGHIHNTSNPPLDLNVKLAGRYREHHDQIIVILEDANVAHAVHPVMPKVELTMTLATDWQTGTATYIYQDPTNHTFNKVNNAKVIHNSNAVTATSPEVEPSLFIASYHVGESNIMGNSSLNLNLAFNSALKTVQGQGVIFNDSPNLIKTYLDGHYTYMTVMPNNSHILITAMGYPVPVNADAHYAIEANLSLQMVLESDWQSGRANFTYLDADGRAHKVTGVPVKKISN